MQPLSLLLLLTSSPRYTHQTAQAPQKLPNSRVQEGGQAAWPGRQKHRPPTLSPPPGLPIGPRFNQIRPRPPFSLLRGPSILPAHRILLKILQNEDQSSTAPSHPLRVLHHPITAPPRCQPHPLQRSLQPLSPPQSHYPPDSPQSRPPRPKVLCQRAPIARPFPTHLAPPRHHRRQHKALKLHPRYDRHLRDHRRRPQNHHPFVSLLCQVQLFDTSWKPLVQCTGS